jgi:hypothetical protein
VCRACGLTAGHRQGPSDGYFKFRIVAADDMCEIDSVKTGNTPGRYRCAISPTAVTPDDAGFRAAKSKSAKTNLRHAHRLFSSDHQPAQHPAMPVRLPDTTSHFQAAARWIMRALPQSSNPPTWPLRSARRFQAIKNINQ